MISELANSTIIEKGPIVVELIGPAGAGKTTLLNALNQRNVNILPGIYLSETKKFAHFISNTFHMLPTYLRQYRSSRWFSRREIRTMVYLKAWLHELHQYALNDKDVILLDHGPIYRLALMREFGPEFTKSHFYRQWWSTLLNEWVATLDIVIWLDAPNSILLERIHNRNRWHLIKGKSDLEAVDFLSHHRVFLEQIMSEAAIDRHATLLCFDTHQKSIEQIVDEILGTIGSVRQL